MLSYMYVHGNADGSSYVDGCSNGPLMLITIVKLCLYCGSCTQLAPRSTVEAEFKYCEEHEGPVRAAMPIHV